MRYSKVTITADADVNFLADGGVTLWDDRRGRWLTVYSAPSDKILAALADDERAAVIAHFQIKRTSPFDGAGKQ